MNHGSIYRFLYDPAQKDQKLWAYLPRSHKKRRLWLGRRSRSVKIPNRVSMNQSQNFALSYGLDAVSALNNGFWDGFMFCEVAMVLGDGIRRNIGSVDTHERALLRDALVELNKRHFPGIRTDMPSSGVSCWFKEDEIHADTHVHGGPEFLPWHRELVNRMEEMLRVINPQLSLHYWDWTQDPRGIPNANLGGERPAR